MVDFSKDDLTTCLSILNGYLKHFELDLQERTFWAEKLNLKKITNLRDKIQRELENA